VVREQLALCHPSDATGIQAFLYRVLKTTFEVPRIHHSSQKTLWRKAEAKSRAGAAEIQPQLPAVPQGRG